MDPRSDPSTSAPPARASDAHDASDAPRSRLAELWASPFVFATVVFVGTVALGLGVLRLRGVWGDGGGGGGAEQEPGPAERTDAPGPGGPEGPGGPDVDRPAPAPDPLADERPHPITPRAPLSGREGERVAALERAARAVVQIRSGQDPDVELSLPVPLDARPDGDGSGFLWSRRGYVVTNAHLVEGFTDLRVTLHDGSEWRADFVGSHAGFDLAVIAIDAPPERLVELPIGTSADLRVGQDVYVLGNPFGIGQTLTTGVLSGLGRSVGTQDGPVQGNFLQTDAAINPGNSGGPLLDSAGRLIGVASAVFQVDEDPEARAFNVGLGFAIPVDVVNRVVPELIRSGIEPHFDLGMHLAPDFQSRQLLTEVGVEGVVPLEVEPGGPAQRAGLVPIGVGSGFLELVHVIVGVDGEPAKDRAELDRLLFARREAPRVTLDVVERHVLLRVEGGPEGQVAVRLEDAAGPGQRRQLVLER